MVNHPPHYTAGGIETIDIMQAKLTREQFIGYLRGSIIRYILRAGKKWNELEDLEKAQWYLNKLISMYQTPKGLCKNCKFRDACPNTAVPRGATVLECNRRRILNEKANRRKQSGQEDGGKAVWKTPNQGRIRELRREAVSPRIRGIEKKGTPAVQEIKTSEKA
jgi:hypothetical protein